MRRKIIKPEQPSTNQLILIFFVIGLALGYMLGDIQVRLHYAGFCKNQRTNGALHSPLGYWITCIKH